MKKSRWWLGAIRALCFTGIVSVSVSCELQEEDSSVGFYRLTAGGYPGLIEIEAGFGNEEGSSDGSILYTTYNLVHVLWHDTYQGEGNWQKDLGAHEVEERAASLGLQFLCVRVRGQGQVSAEARHHFDEETLLEGGMGCGAYRTATAGIRAYWPGGGSGSTPSIPYPGWGPPHETVICSELHRQGLMDEAIYEADAAFGKYLRDTQKEVLVGYQLWAKPVVGLMQKSRVFTRIVNVLAKPWSYEMARIMGKHDRGSVAGKLLMFVGVPMCRAIGRVAIWAGRTMPPRANIAAATH